MDSTDKLNNKVSNAIKWSSVTEILARCIQPITNMILARLLTPEAFGVVATATMIFSFADMLTDAGFQKYLVQHEFKDQQALSHSASVAFWTNFVFSLALWGIISLFHAPLAVLVGNPGLGNVIIVSCISLPLTAFSSIQMSLYKRKFDFKTLFLVRMTSAAVPLVVTVPLAFLFRNYWALIIGTIIGNAVNTVILTIKSDWKPKLYYNFQLLKEMLSFSLWSLVEAISVWLTSYAGTFIVGIFLSSYYLGLYKTSLNTVNQIIRLVTAATTPVLFSGLSRLQNDTLGFNQFFFSFQRRVANLVIPMGFGIFLYRDLITQVLLGSQWKEATEFIGIWGIVNAISVVLCYFCSEVYRAKGLPKLSTFAQIIYLIILIPATYLSAQYGFRSLSITTTLVGGFFAVIHAFIMKFAVHISVWKMFKNVIPAFVSSLIMALVSFGLQYLNQGLIWSWISIVLCIFVYIGAMRVFFPKSFYEFFHFVKQIFRKKSRKGDAYD